jgi:hypothetical protein
MAVLMLVQTTGQSVLLSFPNSILNSDEPLLSRVKNDWQYYDSVFLLLPDEVDAIHGNQY